MSNDLPLVSVVTSSYNRAAYAEASVRSVLDQTYRNIELVVIEDGSSDDSLAVLNAIEDPRLRIIPQANAGNGMALNNAIAHSSGDFVAVQDFGDISAPTRIARQVEVLLSDPGIGVVGCWVSRRDVETGDLSYLRHRKTRPFAQAILSEVPFTHGEVMYRRAIFDAAGRYRRMFKYAVDQDLFIRMSRLCDYAIVEEELYQQLLFPDGISTVPEKLILQAYFAELANQCGERVAAGESDLVETYGDLAPFFMRRTWRTANRIARTALKPMSLGQRDASRTLVDAALREALTPMTALVAAAHRIAFSSERAERAVLPLIAAARSRWARRKAV